MVYKSADFGPAKWNCQPSGQAMLPEDDGSEDQILGKRSRDSQETQDLADEEPPAKRLSQGQSQGQSQDFLDIQEDLPSIGAIENCLGVEVRVPSVFQLPDAKAQQYIDEVDHHLAAGTFVPWMSNFDPGTCTVDWGAPSVFDMRKCMELYQWLSSTYFPPVHQRANASAEAPYAVLVEKAVVCYCNFFFARTKRSVVEKIMEPDSKKPKPLIMAMSTWRGRLSPEHETMHFANHRWTTANAKNKTNMERFVWRTVFQLFFESKYSNTYTAVDFVPQSILTLIYPEYNPKLHANYPLTAEEEANFLNTFVGYGQLVDTTLYTWDDWRVIEFFMSHLFFAVAGANPELYECILTWMACIFHFPWYRERVILVFNGAEGEGKGVVFNILTQLLGEHMAFMGSDLRTLQSRFTCDWVGKLLICYEEVDIEAVGSSALSHLKELATADKMLTEPKGGASYMTNNDARISLCSNSKSKKDLVKDGQESRRFLRVDVDLRASIRKTYPMVTERELNRILTEYWSDFHGKVNDKFYVSLLKFFANFPVYKTEAWVASSNNIPRSSMQKMRMAGLIDLLKVDKVFEWIYHCLRNECNSSSGDWVTLGPSMEYYYHFLETTNTQASNYHHLAFVNKISNDYQAFIQVIIPKTHKKKVSYDKNNVQFQWCADLATCSAAFQSKYGENTLMGAPPTLDETVPEMPWTILKDFQGFNHVSIRMPNQDLCYGVICGDKVRFPHSLIEHVVVCKADHSGPCLCLDYLKEACQFVDDGTPYNPKWAYSYCNTVGDNVPAWMNTKQAWIDKKCPCGTVGTPKTPLVRISTFFGAGGVTWKCMQCQGKVFQAKEICRMCRRTMRDLDIVGCIGLTSMECKQCFN